MIEKDYEMTTQGDLEQIGDLLLQYGVVNPNLVVYIYELINEVGKNEATLTYKIKAL